MRCAVVPVNRSDYLHPAAYSAVTMTWELFSPGLYLVLYSNHSKRVVESLRELRDRLNVRWVELNVTGFKVKDLMEEVRKRTQDCERVYLVPSPGSNVVATSLGVLSNSDPKFVLVNYLFSFGAWHWLYYPFVPRIVEGVELYPQTQFYRGQLPTLEFDSGNEYVRTLTRAVASLNRRTSTSGTEKWLEAVIGGTRVSTTKLDVEVGQAKKVLKDDVAVELSGAYELKVEVEGKTLPLREVTVDQRVVVDTNLIYWGVHTYEVRNLLLPQCSLNEILVKASDFPQHSIVLTTFMALRERSGFLPTESSQCDAVVPRADPYMLEGTTVLTGDRRAFELWRGSPLVRYARLGLVKREGVRVALHDRAMAVANLAVYASMLGVESKLCLEGTDVCVDLEQLSNSPGSPGRM
ncbi:hypothetical protein HS1genome_1775 [Sulfodiicoccus acidiphilus]|uniref:Uncharacterized protein n=1 Tax=Sulfodiicoccus acidiphilus TaxID=1670455 RepID=A0A348B5D4_9CREN|nr:hypothetical protein [Sulfodiicoccus acidiphilus]BBD73386.1 hypothetical protein HS1genome_1775 [Sulfodiicoccus acidiphilus]GGT98887.1 hypothetical protein GCM10007116_15380 [Sulfodiicoccus acidiphilus]